MAAIAAMVPETGPKNKVHRLITIDLPSNIIPSVKMKGFIIPIIAVPPKSNPWRILLWSFVCLNRIVIKPESTVNAIKTDKLYNKSIMIILVFKFCPYKISNLIPYRNFRLVSEEIYEQPNKTL